MYYIYLILLLIILIVYLLSKSSFGNTSGITSILKNTYTNCEQNELSDTTDRVYPSGNIPGSYLGLSPGEKQELLKRFVENES